MEAAQTVTISVPYISQDQYLEYLGDPSLSQFLDVQPSEAQPDTVAFQDSEAGSTTDSEISDLLNSLRDTVSSAIPVPKTPDTSPKAKRRGQPAPQDLHQEKPALQETPENPLEDLHLGQRRTQQEGTPQGKAASSQTTTAGGACQQRNSR